MLYQKFSPCPVLSPYVECYYVWENDEPVIEKLIVESPPSAFSAIVFNYADDYFVTSKNQSLQLVPRQFIVGQLTRSYALHFPGKIGTAAIVFKPTGAASIFNISMYAYTEERTDLKAILPVAFIENIVEAIKGAANASAKARYLEQFLIHFYEINCPIPDVIDKAANQIVERYGQVNINELCAEYAISRRQFERKFLQKVGLSPKFYSRLRRLGHLCASMAGKREVNWQDLYFDSDYYDQSHFIKDFTEFTGRHLSI
ncbi:AraC family transcriptional regulator [Adhaeribacter radiodurans]|uniref:AraC family transcriptional regulator n=1 Tax=Adhaeribacter radiodurans TaxID=2745197 RepID=A0A7L7LAU6_9BACT|nr:helix-turn-helix domain-containing protein [Adhaeribacter radiodurans]QMU29956.1 AraC family transcriptional regulator [Adhaeribacter radiodurans]